MKYVFGFLIILAVAFSVPSYANEAWVAESAVAKANADQPHTVWQTKQSCESSTKEKCFDVLKCPVDECKVSGTSIKILSRDSSMYSAKQARLAAAALAAVENKQLCDSMSGAEQRLCDIRLGVVR